MPYGDRTGPNGQGPLTGRKLGGCIDSNAQAFGFGRSRGRGNRRFYRGENIQNTPNLQQEKALLESRLEEIKKQISE